MAQTGQHVTLVTVFSLIVGMLVSSSNTTVTTNEPSATLSCELYGYLPEQLPTIVWTFDGNQLTDDSVFTITTEDGSHMIQNGGNTPQPSVRSVLTINRPNMTHEGTYFCSASGRTSRVDLQVVEGRFTIRSYTVNVEILAIHLIWRFDDEQINRQI